MEIAKFDKDFNKGKVFLFFEGENCGLCSGMKERALRELKDYEGRFIAIKLFDFPSLRGEFQVFSFPTLLYLKDGVEIARLAGFFDFQKMINAIESEN
ncbi:MAG: thioredoxin family protein [Tissierellia bacterium]|nr:thioredoxin family protein [Tissierellia bacterium]